MQTKLLYNYKSADTELSARLSGLERKLSFGENENLEDKVGAAVENAMSVEIAAREAADERFTEQLYVVVIERRSSRRWRTNPQRRGLRMTSSPSMSAISTMTLRPDTVTASRPAMPASTGS